MGDGRKRTLETVNFQLVLEIPQVRRKAPSNRANGEWEFMNART